MIDPRSLVDLLSGGQLEHLGRELVARFGALNLWTGALLASALLLDRGLARRARASWRIALYAPVGLRVLLPLEWTLRDAGAPRVDAVFAPIARITSQATAGLSAPAPSWHAVAALLYVAGVAFLVARAIVARVRLARALAAARPVAGGLGAPCPVLRHDDLGPMAVGLVAPRIVIPERLLTDAERPALACVLRHESAHLRRGDAWLSASMQVLTIVAWPVAPVWFAAARVRQLVELACDEAALAGADAAERRRYGHALLDLAEWSLEVAPLGAGELHFGSTLRARIEALGAQRHWPIAAQAAGVIATSVMLLMVCGASTPAPAAQAGEEEGYGYAFDKDTPQEAAASQAPAPVAPGPDGRLPPETIQTTVRAHFPAFEACYQAGLKTDPKLTGVVSVKYVFGEDGVVKEAADEGSTLPDASVIACIVSEFGKISYPSGHGGDVTVLYPIELTP